MKAFQVKKNGQTFDYRVPATLDLEGVKGFFEKSYSIIELGQSGRHIIGILNDGTKDLFVKLATTPGISITTQNEFHWNEEFNKNEANPNFNVPKNVTSGEYDGLFYFIAEKLDGKLFANERNFQLTKDFENAIPQILDFSEYIMAKNISNIGRPDAIEATNPQDWFIKKTQSWLEAIPDEARKTNHVEGLLDAVKDGTVQLETKPRHGDFTPWHIMQLPDENLALIDGEHAMSNGVELYDIGYLIQRVHTVSNHPDFAEKIYNQAIKKGHNKNKLKTIMAARAVGGYLDASLAEKQEFKKENNFRDWTLSL